MKKAFAYCRYSTKNQNEMSIDIQEDTCKKYFAYRLASEYEYGGTFSDPETSASIPLLKRPQGKAMDDQLSEGDAVLFPKLDRGFRNTRDLLNTVDEWTKRGITFHMLDLGLDTSTPIGMMMLTVLGAVAEFERKQTRERTMTSKRRMVAQGFYFGIDAPYGFAKQAVEPVRRANGTLAARHILVPDESSRTKGREVVRMRDAGMLWDDIFAHFEGKVPKSTLAHMCKKERALQAKETGAA